MPNSFVENVNKLAANMPVDGWASLDKKVDKVAGKGLSTEDYTSLEKQKLDVVSVHPNTHPVDIIYGLANPSKFVKTDAVGNTGFSDVAWSDVQGKPNSFNPNAHQHSLGDLSDASLKADKTYVDTQLSAKADTSTLTIELAKKADLNIVATNAELQTAVATLQPLSQKGQANGYVPLDSGGKIPNSYLNNLSTIEVFTANSQANMLLLSNVSVGDQCIRIDLASNNLFILTQTPATELTNWKQINTSASVLSVNGQTGVVNVSKTDVGLGNVDNTADVNKAVLSATKLATARTIYLTSDVTGSANFDGSGNISIAAAVADNSHNHTLANISDFPTAVSAIELSYLDGTTSNIQTQLNAKQDTLVSATNIKTINGNSIVGGGDLVVAGGDMLKLVYDTTGNGIVDSAEKLSTPRTINGVSFDGSSNINIEGRLGTVIASATATTIGTTGLGETIHISGTTTITSLGVSVTGTIRDIVFDGALILTYNVTSLILPTSANITTAAGDSAIFVCENGASGYWRCVSYTRRTGYPLTLGNLSTTGSAATLTTARTINGVNFNGSANINIEERMGTIASAATTTIGTSGLSETQHVTGTTTITSLGVAVAGVRRTLIFDGILTITHNATSLILPDGANITTAVGDSAEFICDTTNNWRLLRYTRYTISQSELDYLNGVTSNIQTQFNGIAVANSPSVMTALNASGTAPIYACRAWVSFNGTGTVAIRASGNISSITDNGVGDYTVNYTTAMPDINYGMIGSSKAFSGGSDPNSGYGSTVSISTQTAPTTSSIRIYNCGILDASTTANIVTAEDTSIISVSIFR